MKRLLTVAAFIAVVGCLASCIGEDSYTTSPSERLTFSKDTLDFDTVISGKTSATQTFMVYNRGRHALRIPFVGLDGGASSPFTLNVDGTWLSNGTTDSAFSSDDDKAFTVLGGDSIRVFVQLHAPETGCDEPQLLEDYVTFRLESGIEQTVRLTAAGQDISPLLAVTLTEDTWLNAGKPYLISDSLVVSQGTTLTLTAGTRLYFHPNATLIVHGKLVAQGTLDAPIVMRGDRLDNMFDGQPYDRIPAQWGGIVLAPESDENDMTWCDIHSATWGIRCDSTLTGRRKLIIDNSRIHNTSGHAFEARACETYVGNCAITNAGGDCVSLMGGAHTFVHCTLGQFYPFEGGRGVALRFTNEVGGEPMPLTKLYMVNTLVTGYGDDELMGEASERYPDCAFAYLFDHCLLNTPLVVGDEANGLENCLFEDKKDFDYEVQESDTRREGNFRPVFDLDALTFTFTLHPSSRAIDAADPSLTRASGYTHDLLGNPRMTDQKPDIGAYEFIAPIED